jgi:two-component system NtrC family sensor kinase
MYENSNVECMTTNFKTNVTVFLETLQGALTLPFIAAQIWSLNDRGFHQVFGPDIKDLDSKQIVRQAFLQLDSTYQSAVSVHPFMTENNMCATLLLHWEIPLTDAQHRTNQLQIDPFISDLVKLLKTKRWSRLSGSAQQADQLGKVISLALEIESSTDISHKYKEIHQALSKLMNVENFFIASISEDKEMINFDYYVDQVSSHNEVIKLRDGLLYGSLTACVITSKRLLRGSSNDLLMSMGYEGVDEAEKFYGFGSHAYDWLGVPMLVGNQAIGAIVVQSYYPEILFKDSDPGLLLLLAETLATSLYTRQVREQLEQKLIQKTHKLADANIKLESFIEQLQCSQKKLVEAEKQAALGRLVTGIAHELNTPLGVCVTAVSNISTTSAKVLDTYNNGKLTQSCFTSYFENVNVASNLISSNLQRADKLVQQFKELSQQQDPTQNKIYNMAEVLEEIRANSQHKYAKHNTYSIKFDCHPSFEVQVNKLALLQMFEQLIDNSLEHAFSDVTSGIISINCHEKDGWLNIQYYDNGSGINEDTGQKVFDPFFTTARHKGHAGIGLNSVFNIVTVKLNGNITLDITKGRGAIFNINLPVLV